MKTNIKKTAIILGLGSTGLSVTRSLGQKGIPVIGLDTSMDAPGMHSRYLQKKIVTPSVFNETEYISLLMSLTKDLTDKAVLFASGDDYVLFLSKFRNILSKHFDYIMPDSKDVEYFLDKAKTAEFAQSNNIPHPNTYIVPDEKQLHNIASKIKFPCILKPKDPHIWRQKYSEQKALVIHSRNELETTYKTVKTQSLNILIQEIVPGPDSDIYAFLAYCNKNSEVLASFCIRKLRQYPPHFGIACFCESTNNPMIMELGRNIISKINHKGMIEIEFKIDSEKKLPIFLEANLRATTFGELSVAAGVDFPYIMYQDAAYGDQRVERARFMEGVKLVNTELDLGCLVRLHKNNEIRIIDWLRSFKAKKVAHTYFALDDLGPGLIVFVRFIKMLFTKLLK